MARKAVDIRLATLADVDVLSDVMSDQSGLSISLYPFTLIIVPGQCVTLCVAPISMVIT